MDYYQVLGFDDRLEMDTEVLKVNYKKLVVRFHPDKLGQKNQTEENRNLWNKIQDAYTTMNDDRKRQIYDATLEFDDSMPEKFNS